MLFFADAAIIAVTLGLSLLVSNFIKETSIGWDDYKVFLVYFLLLTICVIIYFLIGLYDLRHLRRPETLIISIIISLLLVVLIYISISYFVIYLRPGKSIIILFLISTVMLNFIWRYLFTKYWLIEPQNILILGKDRVIEELTTYIKENMNEHYRLIESRPEGDINYATLAKEAEESNADLIIYSLQSQLLQATASSLLDLRFKNILVYDAPTFYQRITGKMPINHLDDFWMLINSQKEVFFPILNNNIKRVLDLLIVLIALPVAILIVLISAVIIKLNSRGPIFFVQERLGLNGVPFKLIKLRTMVDRAEELTGPKWSNDNDPRITSVGRVLRKLRIDELPQLINIFKGEMSIVGPRPIRKHFADLLAPDFPYYRLRFLVKPGVTGWAQVNLDYAGSKAGQGEKLQFDIFYLVHQSIWLDLFILFKTLQVMFWAKGT